jgi:hypothetical protein
MRNALAALWILTGFAIPAFAQVSIDFSVPGANIGINVPAYPQLQRVPGYPVYYAPGMSSNYFFYDGMYWVLDGDNWYASSWYNGPWGLVDPMDVPAFVLRVPVRYYRQAPAYFHGWRADAAPQWDTHWGQSWANRRVGWDQWNRKSAPAPAPLPSYQRQYSGNRYPQPVQQAHIQNQNYRYQPKEAVAQQHFQQVREQSPATPPKQASRQQQSPQPQHTQPQHAAPSPQAEHKPQPMAAAHPEQPSHEQSREKEPQRKEQHGNEQGGEKDNAR